MNAIAITRDRYSIAVTPAVEQAAREGAVFVFNLSGGKDSGALADAANRWLDSVGHPRDRRLSIHADLGRAEWKSTPAVVDATAAHLATPLDVVRRRQGDMIQRWQLRFDMSKDRYRDMLIYHMIGPWSSASLRFCQAEMKVQVIGPHLARKFKGQRIIQVIGIRREESHNRAKTPVFTEGSRFAKPGNRAGTSMAVWHPGVDWSTEEVFSYHGERGIPLHEAYTEYGSSRLSCAFCILARKADHEAAASASDNHGAFLLQVQLEADSGYSFQPDRWLGDTARHLLSDELRGELESAKMWADERRSLEAGMPAGLRYVKGWPLRAPTLDEADRIAAARAIILQRYMLPNLYPTATDIIGRFHELLDAKAKKAARKAR